MQALVCKLSREGVTTAVPKRLLRASSTYAAINFLERCNEHLIENSDSFGYDARATYAAVIQTWDRALENMRSLAFGRLSTHRDLVKLIPDVYFLNSGGYQRLRQHTVSDEIAPWSKRLSTIAWRGSVTGSGQYTEPLDIPRVRLAATCHRILETDVKIFGVHETMWNIYPPEEIENFVRVHHLWGDRWSPTDFAKYKFVLDIDGHANAWGLLEKMILGCCVLKISSPYEQWFYDKLHPWKHYVPVSDDFCDLERVISWCRENQTECEWIARNGAVLARSLTLDSAIDRSCLDIMSTAFLERHALTH